MVTSDGFVMCDFIDRTGEGHMGAFVGGSRDVVRNANGLARHLDLSAEDRKALFAALHGWAQIRELAA